MAAPFRLALVLCGGLAALFLANPVRAAVLVIDGFDDGFFTDSNNLSAPRNTLVYGEMLGGARLVRISTDRRPTMVTAEVKEGSSMLEFGSGIGPKGGLPSTGSIFLRWYLDEPLDLTGYEAFRLSFSSVTGSAELNVGIGEGTGSTVKTWPLTQAGEFLFPVSKVNFAGSPNKDAYALELWIYGTTTDFAFTLDEFALIPEPASSLLILTIAGILFRRRHSALNRL